MQLAYYLLKKRHIEFAKGSLKIALVYALVACMLQLVTGDRSGKIVAKHQPLKLAAFEAQFQTEKGAGLSLFGVVNSKEQRLDYAVKIPKLLSFLSFGDSDAEVAGLDQFPKKDWPKVGALFPIFRLMILCWVLMVAITLLGFYKWWRKSLFESKWTLRVMVASVLLPQIANQAGWVAAEMGRYPWIVYNLLRISDGLSKSVTANQVLGSLVMFTILYFILFLLFLHLLNEKFKSGPNDVDIGVPYHHLNTYVSELKHELPH